jgi:GntR family transcriptional regulator/MocR family aminotransferase
LRLAPVDDFGLDVGAVRLKACRLVYATPSHQFPTGAAMPFARRMALLEWARKKQAFLLEDDYDSEYQHDGKPIAALRALDDERVIYVATLARSYAPSLRLGFVIAPRPLREALASAKWLTDRGSPEFEQLVLADFISSGAYERHLRRMGKLYGERRTRLIESVRRHFGDEASVTGASAGVHVFMRLNLRNPADAPNVALAARKAGVGVYSACRYFVNMPKRGGFLLGYATTPPDLIDQGVARFARVWRDFKRAA